MPHRLFTVVSALSLLLLFATLAAWIASARGWELTRWHVPPPQPVDGAGGGPVVTGMMVEGAGLHFEEYRPFPGRMVGPAIGGDAAAKDRFVAGVEQAHPHEAYWSFGGFGRFAFYPFVLAGDRLALSGTYRVLIVPFLFVLAAAAVLPALWLAGWMRRRARRREGGFPVGAQGDAGG
ncbi:MAG: hypothetical protein JWO31_417 [Phycisphaerales bacterium]|nr:hypothetical protein [Phycisphaerales bacterium]